MREPSPVPVRITPFTCILLPSIYLLHSISGIKKVRPARHPIPIPNTNTKAGLLFINTYEVG